MTRRALAHLAADLPQPPNQDAMSAKMFKDFSPRIPRHLKLHGNHSIMANHVLAKPANHDRTQATLYALGKQHGVDVWAGPDADPVLPRVRYVVKGDPQRVQKFGQSAARYFGDKNHGAPPVIEN
jgi:hypothetical protein